MIDTLRNLAADVASALAGGRDQRKDLGRLRSRVELIASDLDCDTSGSIAAELAALRDEHNQLSARVDEWIPTQAEKTAREDGMR